MDANLRLMARMALIPLVLVAQFVALLIVDFFILLVPSIMVDQFLTFLAMDGSRVGDHIQLFSAILAWILVIGSIVWLLIYDIRNYKRILGFETPNNEESTDE